MKGLFLVPLYLPIDETSFMPLNLDEQLIFVFPFRLQSIEKEYEVLKIENPRLRLEIDKLRVVSCMFLSSGRKQPSC